MWRVTQSFHVSWLISFASVGVLAGVVWAVALPVGLFGSIAWLLTGTALCLTAFVKQRRHFVVFAILGGLLVGLWRGSIEQADRVAYQGLYGQVVMVTGTVSEDSDTNQQGSTVLRLADNRLNERKLPGKLWVTLDTEPSIQRSDRVTVQGNLQEGFGTFPGSIYSADVVRVERPEPGDVALKVRDWFAGAVRIAIPEPEASLGVGYLVGQRRTLPEDLDAALKTAGLTHIVVASGYNLTILVRLARRLFVKISKYLSALVSGSLIVGFIAVTGMSPSMSRAGLIAGLALLAWYYGRKFHPLVLLPIAAATTVVANPSYAWGDVGWQLSFTAFAGVMVLAPLLQAYYFGNKKPGMVRQILGETIAAWLCTLPILMLTFGYVSNVAIIANLLILPLVPLAMLLVFIAGIGAVLMPVLAIAIGFPAQALLSYMTQTAFFLANLPWAQSEVSIQPWHVALMYALLVGLGLYMWHKTQLSLRDSNIVE